MKKIATIILNYNGLDNTIECLQSFNNLKTIDFKNQIYVIDYGNDKTQQIVLKEKFFKINLIRKEGNLGFAGGNNIGIKQALSDGADYILLLNNDTLVKSDFMQHLFDYLEKEPQVGAVAPKIYFSKGYEYHKDRYQQDDLGKVIWFYGGKIDWQNMYGSHGNVDNVDKGQFNKIIDCDYLTGCAILIRKEVFEKIGLLNEDLFLYFEDLDYSLKIIKAGWKIKVIPDSIIWHKNAGGSGSGSALHDYYTVRNRLYIGMKYAPLRTRMALIRESFVKLISGRTWEKRGVLDFYLHKMGKGSYAN